MSDWKYPVSREWIVLTHLWDLLAAVNSKKKPKPYPGAPWGNGDTKRLGKTKLPRNLVIERLKRMNPKE